MSFGATGPRPSPGKGVRPGFQLISHPATPTNNVRGVDVDVRSNDDEVLLTFFVHGQEHVVFPQWLRSDRADELWKTTCFEMFLAPAGSDVYFEFNFSPSTRWAAYRFDGYRSGMTDFSLMIPPRIESDDSYVISVDLSDLPRTAMRIGLCAVIEETDGTKSYWALAHAPGPPDFHNPDCFIATLPAPEPP